MVELYEQINQSLAAVSDWEENDTFIRWCGLFHNKLSSSTWDDLITYFQGISDWLNVAKTKRMAELYGYSSATIDDAVKDFLTNYPMFVGYALPKNGGAWFTIGHSYILHGYRWARELSWQEAKWDATSGYNGLKHCFDIAQAANKVFHRCNPDAGTYETVFNGRLYEGNHLANCFWIFYKGEEIAGAKTDYIACWTWINTYLWSGTFYNYSVDEVGYVWDGPSEALQIFGKLYIEEPSLIPNFNRLRNHVNSGYLNSAWESHHFKYGVTNYHYVTHHELINEERRTRGNILAFAMLWQVVTYGSSIERDDWRDMIQGTGIAHDKGWNAQLEVVHGMYDSVSKMFKDDSTDGAVSNLGTALACINLMILGIAPSDNVVHGALAIPCESMQLGSPTMFNPQYFQWDETNRRIRIPVFSGNLTFIYGASDVTYDFPTDGVYDITFNVDYTVISDVTKVSNLPDDYYLRLDFDVTTKKANTITYPNATLHGSVTSGCEVRGFDWGKESGVYTNNWSETGAFDLGDFSRQITVDENNRFYYFRAKCKRSSNDASWTYGDEYVLHFPTQTWLSTDYLYRKLQTINQAAGAGTNYQKYFKVYYGNGVDGDEVVDDVTARAIYCNSHCKTDFGDIRFTTSDGITDLDYWIERKVDNNYALIWVEVSGDLSTGNVNIYIYYGDAGSSTTSDMDNTMIFADDFETDLSKWLPTGLCVLSATHAFEGTYGVKCPTGSARISKNSATSWSNVAIHVRYYDQKSGSIEKHIFSAGGAVTAYNGVDDQQDVSNYLYRIDSTYYKDQLPARTVAWHRLLIRCYTNKKEFLCDGTKGATDGIDNTVTDLWLGSGWAANAVASYFDLVFVRKYVSPEPAFGATGLEEDAPSTPADPTNLAGICDNNHVYLSWVDNATNDTAYYVERDDDGWHVIAALPANSTSYTDNTIESGQPYTYRVRAYESVGGSYSGYSISGVITCSFTPVSGSKYEVLVMYKDKNGKFHTETIEGTKIEVEAILNYLVENKDAQSLKILGFS